MLSDSVTKCNNTWYFVIFRSKSKIIFWNNNKKANVEKMSCFLSNQNLCFYIQLINCLCLWNKCSIINFTLSIFMKCYCILFRSSHDDLANVMFFITNRWSIFNKFNQYYTFVHFLVKIWSNICTFVPLSPQQSNGYCVACTVTLQEIQKKLVTNTMHFICNGYHCLFSASASQKS